MTIREAIAVVEKRRNWLRNRIRERLERGVEASYDQQEAAAETVLLEVARDYADGRLVRKPSRRDPAVRREPPIERESLRSLQTQRIRSLIRAGDT